MENEVIDVYSNMAETISKSPVADHSLYLKKVIRILLNLSEFNYKLFVPRMPDNLTNIYRFKIDRLIKQLT